MRKPLAKPTRVIRSYPKRKYHPAGKVEAQSVQYEEWYPTRLQAPEPMEPRLPSSLNFNVHSGQQRFAPSHQGDRLNSKGIVYPPEVITLHNYMLKHLGEGPAIRYLAAYRKGRGEDDMPLVNISDVSERLSEQTEQLRQTVDKATEAFEKSHKVLNALFEAKNFIADINQRLKEAGSDLEFCIVMKGELALANAPSNGHVGESTIGKKRYAWGPIIAEVLRGNAGLFTRNSLQHHIQKQYPNASYATIYAAILNSVKTGKIEYVKGGEKIMLAEKVVKSG